MANEEQRRAFASYMGVSTSAAGTGTAQAQSQGQPVPQYPGVVAQPAHPFLFNVSFLASVYLQLRRRLRLLQRHRLLHSLLRAISLWGFLKVKVHSVNTVFLNALDRLVKRRPRTTHSSTYNSQVYKATNSIQATIPHNSRLLHSQRILAGNNLTRTLS
ncbi:hypothetical protein NX059_004110 [Plenodomus lindquistii]|nr:hypothetical protein NX059_004110 [Plenodomus lindquistii]